MDSSKLSGQDLIDIIYGSSILGACGGGLIQESLYYLSRVNHAPYNPKIVALSSISDDTNVMTPFVFGDVELPNSTSLDAHTALLTAIRLANPDQPCIRETVGGIVPVEIGPVNLAVALYVSALTGIPVIDADPRGRSVPEIGQSTWALHKVPVGTISVVTSYGEEIVVRNVESDSRQDALLRSIVRNSGNRMTGVDHVLPISQMRHALIKGTVSKCWDIGKLFHCSDVNGLSSHIASKFQGKVIFKGTISNFEKVSKKSFTKGIVSIKNNFNLMTIHVQNEAMYAEINGKVMASIPDIISIIDDAKGTVLQNPQFKIGCNASVLILPSPEAFLTEDGLSMLGPKYAGLRTSFRSEISSCP